MATELPRAVSINTPQIQLAIAALATCVALTLADTKEAERASDEFAKLLTDYRPDCTELLTKLKHMVER